VPPGGVGPGGGPTMGGRRKGVIRDGVCDCDCYPTPSSPTTPGAPAPGVPTTPEYETSGGTAERVKITDPRDLGRGGAGTSGATTALPVSAGAQRLAAASLSGNLVGGVSSSTKLANAGFSPVSGVGGGAETTTTTKRNGGTTAGKPCCGEKCYCDPSRLCPCLDLYNKAKKCIADYYSLFHRNYREQFYAALKCKQLVQKYHDCVTKAQAWDLCPTLTFAPMNVRAGPSAKNCCYSVHCGTIVPGACHCWIEVSDCYDKHYRYEVWQDPVPATGGNGYKRIGTHLARNMFPSGTWPVNPGQSEEVCGPICEPCPEQTITGVETTSVSTSVSPCNCIAKASENYKHKDTYSYLTAPNSNTFIQHVIDACGLKCSLPACAIGWNYSPNGCVLLGGGTAGNNLTGDLLLVGGSIGTGGVQTRICGVPAVGVGPHGITLLYTLPWSALNPFAWF
jgi:hypothetical protein